MDLESGTMFPLISFSVRGKVVFERHIFMPERLNFFHRCRPRQQRNQSHLILAYIMLLDLNPVSTLQTKVQSPTVDSINCTQRI